VSHLISCLSSLSVLTYTCLNLSLVTKFIESYSWLGHYAASRKFTGSSPDEVIFFN
jgi:hypothetical protein